MVNLLDRAAIPAVPPNRSQNRNAVATGRGSLLQPRLIGLGVLVVAVVTWGLVSGPSNRYALVLATIYAIAIIGSNAITGTLGEMNLSAGAFMAVGAYASAIAFGAGLPLELAVLAGVVAATVLGAIVAVPTIRLKGIFTALVTFALAFAIPDLITQLEPITGGQAGKLAPVGGTFLGLGTDGSAMTWLVVVIVLFAIVAVASLLMLHGRIGRVLLSIGESPKAAMSFGIRTRIWEVGVWTWSAMLSGLAGALYGVTVGYLTPELFPFILSITILVGTVVGGMRSAIGAWLGGAFIGLLPLQLDSVVPAESAGLLYGAVLLAVLFSGGLGLGGLLERLALTVRDRIGGRS
jgi:branched-chain amino acid transport system permease protein